MAGSHVRLILLVLVSLVAASGSRAAAQNIIDRQYRVKAEYLYYFGKYVKWPPETGDQLVIGVLGKDSFGKYLRTIENETVAKRTIVVRRFDSMTKYIPCQILFISGTAAAGRGQETAEDRLKAALEGTRGSPVLLVGESRGLAQKGAMINFRIDVQANRIRMDINENAAKRAGLAIDYRLRTLKVVTIVENGETGSG